MKTTDSRDPLDRQIDQLLSSRPVQPSADFMDRVLSAVEETDRSVRKQNKLRWYLRSGMGIAAALACAFVAMQMMSGPQGATPVMNLSTIDAQEIFMLEEGLSNFPEMDSPTEHFQLMATFDAIYFELES